MNPLDPPTEPVVIAQPGWTSWDVGPMSDPQADLMGRQLAAAGRCQFDRRTVVTKDRRETRHGLHLLLTFCTFGVWAFTGWPIAWAWNRFGPRRKTITTYR